MTNKEYIDLLCQNVHSAECKNTLHACREGHPLGINNYWKWRNAHSLVVQARIIGRDRELTLAEEWLKQQADNEWKEFGIEP